MNVTIVNIFYSQILYRSDPFTGPLTDFFPSYASLINHYPKLLPHIYILIRFKSAKTYSQYKPLAWLLVW